MAQKRPPTDVSALWGAALVAVHCAHCGEAHLVPQQDIPPRCPFCRQGLLTPQPAYLPDQPPEQMVPFGVSEQELTSILDRWSQGIWFRPAELSPAVLMQRLRRYLVPLWLVDGSVEGVWRADVGFDYQVVSYQDKYSDASGWHSWALKEDRVRWEPRVGRISRSYENLVAPALDDHRALMDRLGAYDLDERTGYNQETVSDAAVRIPSLEPQDAWTGAQTAFTRAAQDECRQAAGADHARSFALEAQYDKLNWTLLLLPAYVTWYREGQQVWPLLINGQSGHVSGARRASAEKANTASLILGGAALFLFLAGLALTLLGAVFAPAVAIGGVLVLIGLLLGIVAPVPALSVWAFNRRASSYGQTNPGHQAAHPARSPGIGAPPAAD